jgi:hypothetical protein
LKEVWNNNKPLTKTKEVLVSAVRELSESDDRETALWRCNRSARSSRDPKTLHAAVEVTILDSFDSQRARRGRVGDRKTLITTAVQGEAIVTLGEGGEWLALVGFHESLTVQERDGGVVCSVQDEDGAMDRVNVIDGRILKGNKLCPVKRE